MIWRSEGPSGPNRDYLFRLEEGLEGFGGMKRFGGMEGEEEGKEEEGGEGRGCVDEHVRGLAERVRRLERDHGTFSGWGMGIGGLED